SFGPMRNARGFTLVETLMALAVAAIMLRMVVRPVSGYLARSRSRTAATVVASDLDMARATAIRQRQPVRLAFNSTTGQYRIQSRAGTVYKTVSLGSTSDYHMNTITFAPATVNFFPNGVASSALTVSLVSGTSTRTVTLSRVGQIRIP